MGYTIAATLGCAIIATGLIIEDRRFLFLGSGVLSTTLIAAAFQW